MADRPFISHQEHLPRVGSTNDVVRGWLTEGTPEVCLAVADEQTEGRGREGRTWQAPKGAALLLSLGFRPTWLAPELVWRLAAAVSLFASSAASWAKPPGSAPTTHGSLSELVSTPVGSRATSHQISLPR